MGGVHVYLAFTYIMVIGIATAHGQSDDPTFAWDDSEHSPDNVPLLHVQFPDGSKDVAILKRLHQIRTKKNPKAPLDKCIFHGSLKNEPDVLVTLTDGCPPSNSFQIQFKSKHIGASMFHVKNGQVTDLYDDKDFHKIVNEEMSFIFEEEREASYITRWFMFVGYILSQMKEAAITVYEEFIFGMKRENGDSSQIVLQQYTLDQLKGVERSLLDKKSAINLSPDQKDWFKIRQALFTNCYSKRELPIEGVSMNITVWYDQLFKNKFQEDSINVIRRAMAHAQHIFQYPSLKTKVNFEFKGVKEIPISLTNEDVGTLLAKIGDFPKNKNVNLNLFLSFPTSIDTIFGSSYQYTASACTLDLRFRVAFTSSVLPNSLVASKAIAKIIARSLGINNDFVFTKTGEKRTDSKGQVCEGDILGIESGTNLEWSTCSVEDFQMFYAVTSVLGQANPQLCSNDNYCEKIVRGERNLFLRHDSGGLFALVGRHKCFTAPDSKYIKMETDDFADLVNELDGCPEDGNEAFSKISKQM